MEYSELSKLTLDEIQKQLRVSVETGLSSAEANSRLQQYGNNEIPEKKSNPVLKLLSYFWGPIPAMILIAAALSGVLQHWPDLGVILALLVVNAIIGFREEHQASSAIAALKAQLSVKARVERDGKWTSIATRELVPGDVIRLRNGDIVPADSKLLQGDTLQIDESALTGESLPVEKKTGEVVYSGSIVKQGEIGAVVFGTGINTYFGKTVELVESAVTRSHLQKAVIKIADYLIVIAIILAVVIVAVAISRNESLLSVLQLALVLTIAAVPVAMPAVLSVTMALGAAALAAKNAIVTKLTSVEELASIDVLCSDKTGTLTKGSLTIGEAFTVNNVSKEDVILAAVLASREENRDPIDIAVMTGLKDRSKLLAYQVLRFQPFNPVDKRTEALVKFSDGREFKVSKGAPQVIIALDSESAKIQPQVDSAVAQFAARGFRSLGVAKTDSGGAWQFIGIIPLFDPLREDSKDTVNRAKQMGLTVKMVTGDQIAIAREIAGQLDLGGNIVDAGIFAASAQHEQGQLADAVEAANGFAQVFPEHKYHIVELLQKRGHIVAMTGDGVNDAPALKKADAGIAVAGATDAARAAASIVLITPGLSVIIDAIREARKIFNRMVNYSTYRIAETVALLGFITLAILLFRVYPVTAIMIVLLAILNDGAILSIAYDNVRFSDKPEIWNMKTLLGVASIIGAFAMLKNFSIFYLGNAVFGMDSDRLATMIYLTLSVGGHFTVFATRTHGPFWTVKPSRVLLFAVIGTQIIATFIAVYGFLMAPLGWEYAGFVWAYSIAAFLVQDRVKLFARKIFSREESGLLVKQR
jgi:H+-transporting ATPase